MRPQQALELHADLTAKMENSHFQAGMARQINAATGSKEKEIYLDNAEKIAENSYKAIKNAETFFVSEDMTELVNAGSRVLDATDLADPTMVPTPHGFCYFEKGLRLTDVRGEEIIVNALVWTQVFDDLYRVHMFNDGYREPDDISLQVEKDGGLSDRIKKVFGRWGYVGLVNYRSEMQIGPAEYDTSEYRALIGDEGVDLLHTSDNPRRVIHSLFLMLNQTIVDVSEQDAEKKLARRMKWMKLPTMVTVIQLRRKKYTKKHEGETKVEWSHRWPVRGFWRWQQYKDAEGAWRHKRIWIDSYIKGPEDKPLIITKKVNALVR